VVVVQFLQAFFQAVGDLLLHLLGGGAGPGGGDGHDLDGKRRVFSAPQLAEREDPGGEDRNDQKQRDGAVLYRQFGEVDAAHAQWSCLRLRASAWAGSRRTVSPLCSKCAPRATTIWPGVTPLSSSASSWPRLATLTGAKLTLSSAPITH